MEINLTELMQKLYENNEYYVSIPPRISKVEQGGICKDPDGLQRNLFDIKEKQSYLSNNKYILDYLNTLLPSKILDIGCGLGWILSELSSEWDKYGVEPNSEMSHYVSSFANITNGKFEKETFRKVKFDVILTHHVIEHIEEPIIFIQEIKNILKNNGILILATPNFDSGCARRFNGNYRLLNDPTHISLFSNDSMHRFLRDYGFNIKRVEYPYFQTEYFNKENLQKLFKIDNMSPPFYGNYMTFFCKKSTLS